MGRPKVLLLARYGRLGASTRVRSLAYLPALLGAGFDVDVEPLFDDAYVERLYDGRPKGVVSTAAAYAGRVGRMLGAGRYDLVWIEKECLPGVPAALELALLRGRAPLVVDYDDAVFHRYDAHRSRVVRAVCGTKIDRVMRRADVVLAGSPYLAERARAAGARRVVDLPTVVDAERYRPASGPRDEAEPFTVGWIGTPRTARYLEPLAGAFAALAKEVGARFVLVGAGEGALARVPNVERPAWSETTEVREILRADVGVMPLPDQPFERGKCGYKLIQFQACGKPVVASPVGVNVELVANGRTGYLARNPREWLGALLALARDPELRERKGEAGFEQVMTRYALHVTAPRVVGLFRELVEGAGERAMAAVTAR